MFVEKGAPVKVLLGGNIELKFQSRTIKAIKTFNSWMNGKVTGESN